MNRGVLRDPRSGVAHDFFSYNGQALPDAGDPIPPVRCKTAAIYVPAIPWRCSAPRRGMATGYVRRPGRRAKLLAEQYADIVAASAAR